MWIFLNTGPVSVVAHREHQDILLVRARKSAHLQAALGEGLATLITENETADYRFRAEVEKTAWANRLAELTSQISYDNFKNSVKDASLKQVYMSVWSILAEKFGAFGRG